jgi:hypothetical protein
MHQVLNNVKSKFCSACQLGQPSKLIGYKSSGTCLDYIYDTYKVPYSLAWEIYSNEVQLPELEFAKQSFKNLRVESMNGLSHGEKHIDRDYIKQYTDDNNEYCLKLFNPVDKISYDFIINNWTMVFIFLISRHCWNYFHILT